MILSALVHKSFLRVEGQVLLSLFHLEMVEYLKGEANIFFTFVFSFSLSLCVFTFLYFIHVSFIVSHTLLKFCSFVFIAFSFCFSSCLICTAAAATKSLQSCLTLCDPIDGGPRGSPVPGILQARTLEWVAISFFNA